MFLCKLRLILFLEYLLFKNKFMKEDLFIFKVKGIVKLQIYCKKYDPFKKEFSNT